MRKIGILGGMGPSATADFFQRIVHICQTKYKIIKDSDFPPVVLCSLQISELDETGILDYDLVLNSLKEGIKTLEVGKVDFIVIDCNTVHLYIDELRNSTHIPVLSIIEEVFKETKKRGYKRIGVIGSKTTIEQEIYDKVFGDEIELVKPTADQQEKVTSVILRVMGGENNHQDIESLEEIMKDMSGKGAEAVVLACTELPVATRNYGKFKIPVLDSNDILAESAVKRAKDSTIL